jgi:hypothetical protein
MIPMHTRVVAIDDNEEHLQKITWSLGKAGFCPIPYFFDDGQIENPPPSPIEGIRLIFTDVHLTPGAQNREAIHASNIIRCIKKIVAPGPYALIFWTQYPDDATRMSQHIQERAREAGLTPPVGYGGIDKNAVFVPDKENSKFDALQLRDLIIDEVKAFKTIAVATSWEDRVFKAAARTANRLFDLSREAPSPVEAWEHLLAYLACESVGHEQARSNLTYALDSALFPLLEDQLTLMGKEPIADPEDLSRIVQLVSGARAPSCPTSIEKTRLNSNYLIDEVGQGTTAKMWERGMVTALGGGFVNSGDFVRAFGKNDRDLINKEFTCTQFDENELRQTKLHVVELGPECDHVQSKVVAHRYLLALLVPSSLIQKCKTSSRNNLQLFKYSNLSIVDTGALFLDGQSQSHHLLISCRCFMTLAPKTRVAGKCRFRLRRSLLEEVAHHYATHARRPGVMRFQA